MKRIFLTLFFLAVFFWATPVMAAEDMLPDLSELESAGEQWMPKQPVDLSVLFLRLLKGEDPLKAAEVNGWIRNTVRDLTGNVVELFRQVLLLVLCAALFHILAGLVEDRQIAQMGFYILFMLLAFLLIRDFVTETKKMEKLLQDLCSFMQASCAAYSLAVLGASGSVSAAFFTQGLLLVTTLTQKLIVSAFLPVMVCEVLLGICDKISEERLLSVLTEGMEKLVLWGLRSVMAAVTGIQILRNMLAPAFDTFQRSLLGRAAQALPGIGSMVDAAAETLLASAVLIRNCLGIVVLLVLLGGSLLPVLYMLLRCGMFYLLAAFAQPVADKRIVGCLKVVARGYGIYARLLAGTVLLFFLTVAVMTQTA